MRASLVTLLATLALVPAGCAQVTGEPTRGDGGGFVVKKPPTMQPGTTATECMGITDRGRCEVSTGGSESAVVCDTDRNLLRRIDCSVMGRHCVMDTLRGATCIDVAPSSSDGGVRPDAGSPVRDGGMPTDAGMSMPMCPTGVDYAGYCTTRNQAIWCDPSTGSTVLWDCGAAGNKVCAENSCTQGAYCCPVAEPTPTPTPTPSPSTDPCGGLTFSGVCNENHARYCSTSIVDIDCATRGQTCQVDVCASGAYCCDVVTTMPDMAVAQPPDMAVVDNCGGLDYAGVCDANVVRYCSSNAIRTIDCTTSGKTCQVNVCGTGAYCCQ